MLARLKQVGISDYSIFRRGQDLFLYLRVDDFERAWDEPGLDPVNQRRQKFKSRFFEPVADAGPGDRFNMMKKFSIWSSARFRLECNSSSQTQLQLERMRNKCQTPSCMWN